MAKSFFDTFAEKERISKLSEEEREKPQKEEPKGPTIKEILATKSDLFGDYLEGEGDEGRRLGEKLKAGDLDRHELRLLSEKRRGFLDLLDRAKHVVDVLDVETLKEIIKQTPELKDLEEVAGPEVMRRAVVDYLPAMAFKDRARFIDMSDHALRLKKRKEEMLKQNEEIKKICDEYDIDEEEYAEALLTGKRGDLEKIVRSKLGRLKTFFRSSDHFEERIDALDQADEIRVALAQLEGDLRSVGSSLEMALMENHTFRGALVAGLVRESEAPKLEKGMGFSEVKRPTKADVQAEWKKYNDEYAKDHGGQRPEDMRGGEYKERVDEFTERFSKKRSGGKKGFWASVCEGLHGPMVADFIKRG